MRHIEDPTFFSPFFLTSCYFSSYIGMKNKIWRYSKVGENKIQSFPRSKNVNNSYDSNFVYIVIDFADLIWAFFFVSGFSANWRLIFFSFQKSSLFRFFSGQKKKIRTHQQFKWVSIASLFQSNIMDRFEKGKEKKND